MTSKSKAFTLIELLVVIGVIGVLAGFVGLGFRETNPTVAIKAAQGTLSSLVTAARGQAALNQVNAAIVVWGNKDDPETFLRQAAVFILKDPIAVPPVWEQKGDVVVFPMGAYLVPPEANNLAANGRARLEPALIDWVKPSGTPSFSALSGAHNAESTSTSGPSPSLRMTDGRDLQVYQLATFTPYGTIAPFTLPGKKDNLVVANAERESSGASTVLVFRNSATARGVKLSTYGIPTLVNDKLGFE